MGCGRGEQVKDIKEEGKEERRGGYEGEKDRKEERKEGRTERGRGVYKGESH